MNTSREVNAGPAAKDPRAEARRLLKELALLVPNFVLLLKGLIKDPRVPRGGKLSLLILLGYLLMPIDLIPDFIPGIGQLDDLVIAAIVLDNLVNRVGDDVVREHWRGGEDILELLRKVLAAAAIISPSRLSRRFNARIDRR